MSLHVGEAIGDYRIIGIIGAGGMGQVFQVEHKITKRKEAMKVLLADLADETQVERFKREIEVQARLNHPNIAAVHNAFRLKDRMVLVLEFVEGQTLESLLRHQRPDLQKGIDYICQALSALSYAHDLGVIHRDVSPANLMITDAGLVKLMDFGVAKSLGDLRLTDSGSMVGSLYYMAPEQVKGALDPDPRIDIYSAGAILYEIVTGKKPFDYQDRFSLMVAQVEELPQPPSQIEPELPPGLDEIILKALEKDPAHRYASAQEFLVALQSIGAPAATLTPERQAQPRKEAIGTAVAAVAGLGICVLAGIGALRWNQIQEPLPPPPVVGGVPGAPPALAAIPPAVSAPALSVPIRNNKRVVKQIARKGKAEAPVAEVKPAPVVLPVPHPHVEAAAEALPQELDPPRPAPEISEPAAAEPEKKSFWGKLNPFHKGIPFRKKKPDSALRSTGETPAERQD